MKEDLINLGFTDRVLQEASLYPDLYLGRVIAQSKDVYTVATKKTKLLSEIAGKLRHSITDVSGYPSVGDFVMLDREEDDSGHAIIHNVLTRKSVFMRRAAGTGHDVQVVAANIDYVFICMSLNNDFNLRRLERYLSIAWDSGATPVIVLTKSDLCNDLPRKLSEMRSVSTGVDLIVTSSLVEGGYSTIKTFISPGKTVAFVGSSGVGKSTLINRLLGEEVLPTKELRKDDKGKHTTTRRELIILPGGGAVIDTPGMRELGVESVNLDKTFTDIDELAQQCRFKNCQHENEPDCAVREAIEQGLLSQERLNNYKKIKHETNYEGLNSRQIEKQKNEKMFADFGGIKNARNYIKGKNR